MFVRGKRHFLLLTLVLLLIAASLSGCGPSPEPFTEPPTEPTTEPPTEPTTEPPPEPTCAPEPALSCPIEETPTPYPPWSPDVYQIYHEDPGFHFSSREFILMGAANQVHDVVSALSGQTNGGQVMPVLELVNEVTLDYMPGLISGSTCQGLADQFGAYPAGEPFVMSLYEALASDAPGGAAHDLDPDNLAAGVVASIEDLVAGDEALSVVADFVWGTGSVDGSPWTAMGSPWTAMGSPFDGLVPYQESSCQPEQAFHRQWAFERGVGIGLHNEDGSRTVVYEGHRVSVGIFDTAPAQWPAGTHSAGSGASEFDVTVTDWGGPIWEWEGYEPLPVLIDGDWGYGEVVTNLVIKPPYPWLWPTNDHGLFIAGLVKEIAPLSTVYLYRVLNHTGAGDLYTLDLALHSFMTQVKADRDRGDLDGAIINLSLGSPVRWVQRQGLLPTLVLEPDDEPESLRVVLAAAECLDIAVVAAAGNTGAWLDTPASFDSTTAAGASSSTGDRSCFSSKGSLFEPVAWATGLHAPGGDGCDSGQAGAACVWALDQCVDGCPNALISTVQRKGDFVESEGYAYGAGTSFSAALVSGFLALGINHILAEGDEVTADAVHALVRNPQRLCASSYMYVVGKTLPQPAPGSAPYIYIPKVFLGEACPYYPSGKE